MGLKLVIYGEVRNEGRWVLAEPWIDSREITDENHWMIAPSGDKQPRQLCWGSRGLWRTLTGHFAGPESAPIAPPRGLPTDLSSELQEFFAVEDFFQGEAPSVESGWLGVSELVDFDWDSRAPDDERARVRGALEASGLRDGIDHPALALTGAQADEIARRTWRELAGEDFLSGIERLRALGADSDLRIIFTVGY